MIFSIIIQRMNTNLIQAIHHKIIIQTQITFNIHLALSNTQVNMNTNPSLSKLKILTLIRILTIPNSLLQIKHQQFQ